MIGDHRNPGSINYRFSTFQERRSIADAFRQPSTEGDRMDHINPIVIHIVAHALIVILIQIRRASRPPRR